MRNKKISLLVVIVSVVGILLTIQEIILAVVINSKYYSINETLFNNFGVNWSQGQINSINVKENSCGLNSKNALVSIYFPGFKSGCFCQSTGYFNEECSTLQVSQGCKNFSETKPKLLYSWGGNICTERPSNQTYFSMKKTDGDCPSNFKKCGVLDSFNSTLCVEDGNACPINKIQIVTDDSKQNSNDQELKLSNGKKLVFSNDNKEGKIVNQFLITDHAPCANPVDNKIQLIENKENCVNQVGDFKHDNSWTQIDSMTLEKLVENNDLVQQVSQYPFWNKIKERNVYLYYRNYIGVKDECIKYGKQYINSETLNEVPSLFLNIKTELYQSEIDFVSPVTITIFIFLLIGYLLKIMIICYESKISYNMYINVVLAASSFILFIVSSISSTNILIIRNNYIWLTKGHNCLDDINSKLLDDMDDPLKDSYIIGIIFIIFALFLLLLVFTEQLLKTYFEEQDEEEKEEKDQRKPSDNKGLDSENEDLIKNEDQTLEMADMNMNKKNK